jgi:gliding motility-associated-like protein
MFNRWGEILFESYNLNSGWNGTYRDGKLVEDGTYIWQIEFGDTRSDKVHTYNGHVIVMR